MQIEVLGAGAWGTALAISASARGHAVCLRARDPVQVQALQQQRVNTKYLPGADLPEGLQVAGWPATPPDVLPEPDLRVIATPMAGLRGTLAALRGRPAPVVWLCKGFETAALATQTVGLMGHEVARAVAPDLRIGVLSGPSFAQEVARQQPTALVAASRDAGLRADMVRAFHGPALRVYASEDIVGVEVGGAVKNVLAIATGLCDGLQLGLNARAALITRGLHEMTRLGVALGARQETFTGLSGLGDLVLTATGDLSRNRRVGLALAAGQSLEAAVQSLGHVAEGVLCATTVVERARQRGVDMPICAAVHALLQGRTTPAEAVAALMAREARDETGL
ncbi:MAG: NAD(P)H-dependent glycerol-3-phosphate dehydrogenase [Rhodoferax sp.]